MTEELSTADESLLTPRQRQQLDQICDDFESAWQQQAYPQIVEILRQTKEPLRSVLLKELLKIETHWREQAIDFKQLRSTLLENFPASRATIEEVLGAGASKRSLTQAIESLGPFHKLEKIGDGGFGLVFRAWDTRHQRQVALKVPRFAHQLAGQELDEFFREAKSAGSLDHPNIARVWDSGTTAGVTYIAYQLVDGENLKFRMNEFSAKTPLEIVAFVRQLADAVSYAHEEGIIHRDIKPSNVLVTSENQPVLTDFGLALAIGGDATRSLAARVGTLDYMSPEQATGNQQEIDDRTDIWSLGVVLYELLTGELPFRGETDLLLCQNICESSHRSPRQLRRDIPSDVEVVIDRCLQKRPGDRLPSCAVLVDELARIESGRPIQSRRVTFIERSFRWCQRNPRPMVAFAVVLATTVFGVWSWGLRLSESRENENIVQQLQIGVEVKNAQRRELLGELLSKDLTRVELLEEDLIYLEEKMLRGGDEQEQLLCAEILLRNNWFSSGRFSRESERHEPGVAILQQLQSRSSDADLQELASVIVGSLREGN